MAKLEDLKRGAAVKGILPDSLVTVVDVKWYGSAAVELTYKDPSGRPNVLLLYRDREPTLEIVEAGRPWSFDGDGKLFRLVSEAHRINLAHLFDPLLAIHTSMVDPLPHQITAVYGEMLPRQPLRFLLADDPGAGKTIMAGLLIKELLIRGDLHRCMIVCPGNLAEQWQDELYQRFQLPFEILTNDKLESARTGNWFAENHLVICRLDKLSRNEDVQAKLENTDWDLIVCDEAHKMSATFFGSEVKYTKRYRLGQLLGRITRHLLLMTATPHNGKPEDFQLFMALLDSDRFEGRARDGVHKGLMILPANVPVDAPAVQSELTRYLPPVWDPIIEKDIDGPNSLPLKIDRENPMLGRYSATRRVARTLYLGSAPTQDAAKKGLEDRQIKLGCVQPGETSGTFGDALRKLADQATYLYVDGSRYWYATQPSVNRLAEERAERYHPEDVVEEIRKRLAEEAKHKGDFSKVHPCPVGSSDVVDEQEAKLVILSPDYPHSVKTDASLGRQSALEILNRGSAGRNCGNMLVFLAADKTRLMDLDKAVRSFMAWQSIDKEKVALNLTPFQANQVEQRLDGSDKAVKGRIPETYVWLLVAGQKRPETGQPFPAVEWQEFRLQGQEWLAERASKKLKNDGLLVTSMAGTILRFEIDQVPLWRGNHVGVKQLADDFAKYLYLPRVKNAQVLLDAIQDGAGRLTWAQDAFAYADFYDAATALAQAKIAYVAELMDICSRFRCKAFASVVNKASPVPAAGHLRKDYAYLFERFFYYLEDLGPAAYGIVVFDELDKVQSHLLLAQMDRYFKFTARGRHRSGQILPEPLFVHSDLTTGVQLADLISYIVSWGVRFQGMDLPARDELAPLAERVLQLRHRSIRDVNENPNFVVWSLAYIRDLRSREEREDELLGGLIEELPNG